MQTSATYTLVQDDVGYLVRVKVSGTSTATNGTVTAITDSASLATAAVANVNDPATGLTVSGTAMVGHELTAGTGAITDLDGTPLGGFVYTYQWQRSTDSGNTWAAISGAIASTYTLVKADVGYQVQVVVGFTDALGGEETLGSDPTAEVQPLQLVQADSAVRSSAVGIAVAPGVVLRAYDAAGVAVATYPALHVILTDGQSGDTLSVDSQVLTDNGVAGNWDATRRVLTLTGGADVAAYQAVLREVVLAGLTVDDTRQVVIAVGPDASLAPFWYTDSTSALRIRYYEVLLKISATETVTAVWIKVDNMSAKFGMRPYLATVVSKAEQLFIKELVEAVPDDQKRIPGLSLMSIEGQDVPPVRVWFGLHRDHAGDWNYRGGPEKGMTPSDLGFNRHHPSWNAASNKPTAMMEVRDHVAFLDGVRWEQGDAENTWVFGYVVEYGHEDLEVAVLQTSIAVTRTANQAATGPVTIIGTVAQEQVLTADTSGITDPDGTPQGGFVFTRQWQRGVTVTDAQSGQDTTTWTDITDADGATYTLVQADVGQQVRVVVSFTDAAGNDESLTSTATGPVADINDAPTGTVTLTGTVEQGEELTVSVSAVADADGTPQGGFVFTRQWQRGVTVTDAQSGQDTTTWTDITDADGATYTLVQADVGQQVRVVVSFTDAAGNDESLTSTATGPVADINDAPTGTVTLTGRWNRVKS